MYQSRYKPININDKYLLVQLFKRKKKYQKVDNDIYIYIYKR